METEIKKIIKSDVLFQFYTWMKIATIAIYIDLFWGINVENTNLAFASFSNIDMSVIILFIICSASIFPLVVISMIFLRSIALFIDILIVSNIKKLLYGDTRDYKVKFHELSYSQLIDHALKEKNDIAYNLALHVSKEYAQMKLNKYITTTCIIFLCFDVNYGSILSNIFIISEPVKYFIYFFSAVISYFLLHNLSFYDTGSYKTTSKAIYDMISKV